MAYFTLKDVVTYYDRNYMTVWRWVREGRLPAEKRVLRGERAARWCVTEEAFFAIPKLIALLESRQAPGLRERAQLQRQGEL